MIRVLPAKPDIDGHDVGVKVVARALGDAGEVVPTGPRTTIPDVARTAVRDDVDVFDSFIEKRVAKMFETQQVRA